MTRTTTHDADRLTPLVRGNGMVPAHRHAPRRAAQRCSLDLMRGTENRIARFDLNTGPGQGRVYATGRPDAAGEPRLRPRRPGIGGFISPDHARAGDNWYASCDNDPLDYVDSRRKRPHELARRRR